MRDKNSARALRALGFQADLVHPDLAMLLYQPGQCISKKNIIGVSLTSLKSQRAEAVSDEVLVSTIADELTTFSMSTQTNVLVRLFVIRSGERESDAPIMNLLHQRLQQNKVRSEVYEFTNDLNALIEQMRPCQVFLASRFHSAVLGAVTQSRLIILSYHNKLVSLAEEVKMNSRFVVDLQKPDAIYQLAGLSETISELYAADQLNYSFPDAEILQLSEQISAIYEEGLNFRVHANLRRAAQSGEPVVSAAVGATV